MKRILLTAFSAVALLGTPAAYSQEVVSHDEWCDTVATLSDAVMSARQNGVTVREVMGLASPKGKDDRASIVARGMIEQAYGSPLYHTEASKRTAITEFQNEWHLKCLQSRQD